MGRNILILLALAFAAALSGAETVKYFKLQESKEITEEEAGRTKHRVEYYDGRGNEISESYFGPGGGPVVDGHGIHRYEWVYDEQGSLVEERTYNVNGDLISLVEKGD